VGGQEKGPGTTTNITRPIMACVWTYSRPFLCYILHERHRSKQAHQPFSNLAEVLRMMDMKYTRMSQSGESQVARALGHLQEQTTNCTEMRSSTASICSDNEWMGCAHQFSTCSPLSAARSSSL
jgi:hypothetical protein